MLLKDMVRALKLAHEKIIKQGGAHLAGTEFKYIKINRTLYSFASPWAVTQTKTLSMKKAEPFEFTPELLTGLIKSQEDRFKKESLEVIERRVIHTRLNGYEVHDPLGKKANSAEVSFFSGIVPKLVIDRIMDISHSTFRLSKHIQVSSFPLISYSAIRDTFHGENDFICVRIDSRVSDISIVADGLIDESGSFPGGQNHIINVISRHLRMSKEETISFLKLYIVGNAESKLVEKFEPLLDRLMGDWVRSLREN
jgi:cell division ATPase FtsA